MIYKAEDLKDGDRIVLNIPLRVETKTLFGTKVLDGNARVEMLVHGREGKLDLFVSEPVVSEG